MGKLFDNGPVLVILLVAVILIFGSKRLPDAARGLGRSLRIFKAETRGLLTDDEQPAAGQAQQVAPTVQAQPVAAPPADPMPATPAAVPPPQVAVPVQYPPVPPVSQPAPPAAPVTPEADQHQ